ncbi:unnamed protein product [Leuciscus chuanchicus]
MGSAARGQTAFWPMVKAGEALTYQLPRNVGSEQSAHALLSPHKGTPRANTFRQRLSGVLHKSPGRPQVPDFVQANQAPPDMGPQQPALAESSARARAPKYRTRQTVQEPGSDRRMVFAPTDSPAAVEEIRQSGIRPVRVSRKRSLSRIFLEEQGRADPRVASPSSLRFSPRLPPDSGGRTGQGRRMLSAACSPTLDEPTLVPNCDAVSEHRPVASASEEGSPLSSQRLDLASSPRAVVPACVGHQRVPADLPQGVLNTITQARAPSTRRLYASKWSVFSSWCTARGVSPLHCGVTEVLSFLQELLDKGRSPSTLKVYVAAIAVFSSTTLGQSIGRNDLVIRFLRGAKRLNPPRPPTVPIWDLSTVLEAMKGHPFEPLQEIDLKHLSFKTAFLLALASVKRIGDLHALSVSATCMEFGPNDSRVILKPKHGYVPKSLNTPFRAQVISLSALPVTEGNMDESSLCPVRALRAYVSRSSVFRQTEQLFVSFSGRSKGLAASKQTLSRWVVDAIALAYTTKGMQCPLGVKAHSTRSMASSWAWSNSCQLQERFKLNGMYQNGDFIIGGLFEVQHLKVFPELNFRTKPELPHCEEFYMASFQQALTMVFAINEINNNNLLPNITLGYQIYDNCLRLGVAFRAAISLLSGTEESFSNLNCTGPPPVIGIVGDPGSTQSIAISSVLGLFRVPMVSYYATCSCLSDRKKYPSFFRTIPSDAFQVRAMVQILKHFGWTWVGLLYSDDDYGIYAAQSFQQEIDWFGGCVAFSEILPYDNNRRDIQRIVEVIQTSTARVVLAFSTDLSSLMDELLLQNVTGKQWIASEAWTTTPVLQTPQYLPLLSGTLGIAIRRGQIQGLNDFLKGLHPDNNPKNSTIKTFWENMFECRFEVGGKNIAQEQEQGENKCSGQEDLSSTDTVFTDVSELRASYNVYKAVYALAHALHDLIQCEKGRGPFSKYSCADISNLKPWQLVHYLEKVNFTTGFGDHVSFNENGDALAIYDVMNWHPRSDGTIVVRTVGVVNEGATTGKVLKLDDDALYWNFETKKPPRSVCSESCPPGTRRVRRKGLPVCCFDCLPCGDGEISNTTDSSECFRCPDEFWSSPENDNCIPKEVEFLSYEDPLGISLTTASLLGTSFCALVMVIFALHRNTPIVRANNSELSFLLLVSLKLCFLCVLLFIGRPQLWTCQLRHVVFGISFVLCISSILVKTMVVIAVFKSSRPEGKSSIKWFGSAQQRGTVLALISTQVAICTVWLSTASPTPHKNSHYIRSKIVYECAIGSVAGFSMLLGYIGLLAAVSFLLAFMARKLPDNFNEAKFITFNSCQSQGHFKLNGMYQDGNVIIGGLFEIQHLKVFPELSFRMKPEQPKCEEFYMSSFQQAQTMVFAIDEINKNPKLLPNITLGYHLYDNCLKLVVAFRAATTLISGTEETFSNLNCTGSPPVIAIVGDPGSTHSIAVSSVLGLFRVPMISYYATCSCLSDRKKYPSFFRTIPSDAFQVRAMVQILKYFGWTWVGVLYSDDDYGIYAAQSFQQEMQRFGGCVAFSEIIPYDNHRDIQRIVTVIKASTARVVVAFSTDLLPLMDELLLQNVTGRQWIASEAWSISPVLHLPRFVPLIGGTLGIAIRRGEIKGLHEFLLRLHPDSDPRNHLVRIFWENMFGCKFENGSKDGEKICTVQEDLNSTVNEYNDVSELRASYNVYKAVYALAHALHDLMQCEQGRGPFSDNSCADITNLQPWQMVHYIQKVNFTTGFGDHVSFDENGDALAIYDVMNWHPSSVGSIVVRTVGVVNEGAATGKVLTLVEDAIYWNFETRKPPRSVCSESCPTGTRRATRKGLPVCCFDCLPCADGEISNTSDSTECTVCPNEFWSSPEKNRCIPKAVEFLSYGDPLGISLTTASLLGSCFCALVMVTFTHHRNTPVVRANNSELSFLLLLSLKLCFLCVLLFIGRPQLWTCQLRHAMFGISFVLCVSSILVKTMVVIAVFKSSRPEGKSAMKWFGAAQQRGTVVVLTAVQVVICAVWLSTASPTPHKNILYIRSKIVYECAIGSVTGFAILLVG